MIFLGIFDTIGDAWLQTIKYISSNGTEVVTCDECYKEVKGISMNITITNKYDFILNKYSNKSNISWMKENFEIIQKVKELKYANSYASRLYNYGEKKNQIDWIIKKINKNKNSRSSTITLFEPLSDKEYIPCICLLDFDVRDSYIDVYVYARSLDWGNKAYANIICICNLLKTVARKTNLKAGIIHLICKSAHVYKSNYSLIEEMCNEEI